ncbi:MAG: hypothetical protein WCG30_01705 [Candidatus Saccharibacteria bacterium]
MADNKNMDKEIINSSEQAKNSNQKVVIIERVADFFKKNKGREINYSDPYDNIIDFDPYLALDILKLGEEMPISRDAYAKGVADGVAVIIEMHRKQESARIIPIQKALGNSALKTRNDFDTN